MKKAAALACGLFFCPASALSGACGATDAALPIPAIALAEVTSGFVEPVQIVQASDNSGLIFVVEQQGRIRIISNGRVASIPFLDITSQIESGGEKGLLSMAFHPDYDDNGYFYVDYTTIDKTGLYTVVSRFSRTNGSPHTNAASEKVLLKIRQPFGNHNGGQIAFGPDGFLYIGMGDGGSANDPRGHGQNLASLLGTMLRIDVNHEEDGKPYAIPPDNPFVDSAPVRPEIWAYGLRNPWRFSFDAQTGDLWLADVGQNEVEEIDLIEKGGNYGWNIMEGDICTPDVSRSCDKSGLRMPIHTYRHPEGFAVTGGFVYRGDGIPVLCGTYLFADYVSGRIWGLRHDGKKVTAHKLLIEPNSGNMLLRRLLGGELSISSFGQGEDRELYIADHRTGKILKIIAEHD
ncbi:MAG: PQQ-dependent sugar dehydrogenase [Mariprofundaceae bacterium]